MIDKVFISNILDQVESVWLQISNEAHKCNQHTEMYALLRSCEEFLALARRYESEISKCKEGNGES